MRIDVEVSEKEEKIVLSNTLNAVDYSRLNDSRIAIPYDEWTKERTVKRAEFGGYLEGRRFNPAADAVTLYTPELNLGCVVHLKVHEELRSRMFGTAFYGYVEDYLKRNGVNSFILISNSDAVNFWAYQGYAILHKTNSGNFVMVKD